MAHTSFQHRFGRAAAAIIAAGALGIGGAGLFSGPSGAATLSCPNFNDSDVPTPPAGQTGYLFIGTSVSTPTSTITVTYSVNGGPDQVVMVDGTQQGGGAYHYIVNLPQGAIVSNATVTGATAQTQVTVSGCLNGPELPTPTTGGTITPGTPGTPGGAQVSPSNAARAAVAPAAVTLSPNFTG